MTGSLCDTGLDDTRGSSVPHGSHSAYLEDRWDMSAGNRSPQHHDIHSPCKRHQTTERDPGEISRCKHRTASGTNTQGSTSPEPAQTPEDM